jgi:uncharacterized protein
MMRRVALVWVVAAGATAFALRPALAGSTAMWLILGVPYLLLAGLATHGMWQAGTLDRLRPRWGDLTVGVLVAVVLMFGAWGTRSLVVPLGTDRQAWLWHVYLQLGPSDAIQHSAALTLAILSIATLEELVWRGMVLSRLELRFGQRRAWIFSALLYASVNLPTAFTLADPMAGPNPLLVMAALGCGMFWGFAASLQKRLPPVAISHAVFAYFMAVQFRPPGL